MPVESEFNFRADPGPAAAGASAGNQIPARKWYCAGVMPDREARAEWHLRAQGFEPFTPRQKRTVRHARRMVVKHAPFFPGYMFIPLDLERQGWRSINGTIGVRSLIMQGERPACCPTGLVERMIEMTSADGLLDLTSTLKAGQKVRIVLGPMAEMLGTLDRMDRSGRVRVLVEIMNREIALTMTAKDLVVAA